MNIQTVANNLRNTIAGKEMLLARYKAGNSAVEWAVGDMLEININELKRILQDVETCCEQYSEMGWQLNPERMGQ